MARLMYYHKEKTEWFPEAYHKELSVEKAEIVFRKLCKHFNLDGYYQKVNLYWVSGNRHPKAYGASAVKLNIDYNNFGVLCHELAHIQHLKKYHTHGHNKKHRRIMRTMINYCKRKNWFEQELERRTAPKIVLVMSKDDLRTMKISRIEKAIKKNQSRIKRLQTAINKANRRLSCLKRFERGD